MKAVEYTLDVKVGGERFRGGGSGRVHGPGVGIVFREDVHEILMQRFVISERFFFLNFCFRFEILKRRPRLRYIKPIHVLAIHYILSFSPRGKICGLRKICFERLLMTEEMT